MNVVYVANLSASVDEDDLRRLFDNYGTVTRVTIAIDEATRLPRGFAFVEYHPTTLDIATIIRATDGHELAGQRISVRAAAPPEQGEGSPDYRGLGSRRGGRNRY